MANDLPQSLEQILFAASSDPAFREALLEDRVKAVQERGYQLTTSEQATLEAVPSDQLALMLDRMPMPSTMPPIGPPPVCTGIRPERPEMVKGTRPGFVAAAVVTAAVIGGGAAVFCSLGSRPDRPEVHQPAGQNTSPDQPPGDGGPDTAND